MPLKNPRWRQLEADDARKPKELPIADLTSIALDGDGVVFVRPKRELSDRELQRYHHGNAHLSDLFHRRGRDVVFVLVPHDVEVFAAGELEMKRHGWMRMPTPETETKTHG